MAFALFLARWHVLKQQSIKMTRVKRLEKVRIDIRIGRNKWLFSGSEILFKVMRETLELELWVCI